MNLPPGVSFRLSDLTEPDLPAPPPGVGELEDIALAQRPELREEDYRRRISGHEVRRAIASTLPSLSASVGWNYDSNKFLLNNDWVEGGIRVSLNLFRLAAIPAIQRQGEAQQQVDDTRRMMQAMAVLTQVRVATLRYSLARGEYDTFAASASVDERLAAVARAATRSRVEPELELIRAEARSVLSDYQRQIAYANAQAAWGRLYNSLGMDIDATSGQVPVRELAVQIRRSLLRWEANTFATAPVAPRSALPVALRMVGDASSAALAEARAVFVAALRAQDVRVLTDTTEPAAYTLEVQQQLTRVQAADQARELVWAVALQRPNASVVGRSSLGSRVTSGLSREEWERLAQGAARAHAPVVADWLDSERRRSLVVR